MRSVEVFICSFVVFVGISCVILGLLTLRAIDKEKAEKQKSEGS